MNPKNKKYLKKIRWSFTRFGWIDKSDLEVIRLDQRGRVYMIPFILTLLFAKGTQYFESLQRSNPKYILDYIMLLVLACFLLWSFARYRRSESCRVDLEDQLVQAATNSLQNKQAEQAQPDVAHDG
jgi:hypothetical protein